MGEEGRDGSTPGQLHRKTGLELLLMSPKMGVGLCLPLHSGLPTGDLPMAFAKVERPLHVL